MNKQDLISAMAEKANATKVATEQVLNAFIDSVSEALAKGESVQLIGFGTFKTAKRNGRTGINPQTKKAIKIPAKTVAQFKAGKALSEKVNKKK